MYRQLMIASATVLLFGCATVSQQPNHHPNVKPTISKAKIGDHRGYDVMMSYTQDHKGREIFPSSRPTTGHKVFIFDPKVAAWAAYDEQGKRVQTGRASGGQSYCADVKRACRTVQGQFRIYAKQGAHCISKKFPIGKGGAVMPYCMYFHGGFAIHGSYDVPDHNASHGCIRVLPSAAQWLNQHFVDTNTAVIVKSY